MEHSTSPPIPDVPPTIDALRAQSEDSKDISIYSISSKDEPSQRGPSEKIILQKLPSNTGESLVYPADDSDSSYLLQGSAIHADPLTVSVSNFVFPDDLGKHLDDEPLETYEQQQTALQFAMEHKIFLRAALALLTERDLRAPTLGMMDPMVLKSGPLKKASHLMNGVWKVKYVEIRRGMFSYYEDAINAGEILRKNIPLQAHACTCRPVRLHQKALKFTPRGAIFELGTGGSRRLWLANSREERQSWLQAIYTATVGGSVTTSNVGEAAGDHSGRIRTVSPKSPFRNDLRLYLKIQASLRQANTKQEYIDGLRELENNPIRVPIKWIAKQTLLSSMSSGGEGAGTIMCGGGQGPPQANAFKEQGVDSSVEQLWRDLQRDSVSINGVVWRGNESHGPEAILGAVAHSILRASLQSTGGQSDMMESQALAYARDILLSGNRTRSGGDSYFCISTLCNHAELVVLTPSGMEAEPVSIIVTAEDFDSRQAEGRVKSKSGWIKKRNKLQRSWKGYFFVLSEGTLSYYDGALPRPHGLRGVVMLTDATINVAKQRNKESNYFVVTINAKDGKEHILRLDHEGRLVEWLYVLEREAKAKVGETPARFYKRKSSGHDNEDAPVSTVLVTDGKTLAEQATEAHAKRLELDIPAVKERIAALALQTTSAVRIAIQACTEYNICTTDPSGIMEEDTWGVIRTHFQQSFRVTGGTGGRIARGEEIVRVKLMQCGGKDVSAADAATPKRNRKGRIFRTFNGPEETTEAESK